MRRTVRMLDAARLQQAGLLPAGAVEAEISSSPLRSVMVAVEQERAEKLERGFRTPDHDWEFCPIVFAVKSGFRRSGEVLLRPGCEPMQMDIYGPMLDSIPGLVKFEIDDRVDDLLRAKGEAECDRRIRLWSAAFDNTDLAGHAPWLVPLVSEDGELPDLDLLLAARPDHADRLRRMADTVDRHRVFAGRDLSGLGEYVTLDMERVDRRKTLEGQAAFAGIIAEITPLLPESYDAADCLGDSDWRSTLAAVAGMREKRRWRLVGHVQEVEIGWRVADTTRLWSLVAEIGPQVEAAIAADRIERYARTAAVETDLRLLSANAELPDFLRARVARAITAAGIDDGDSADSRAWLRYGGERRRRQESYRLRLELVDGADGLHLRLAADRPDLLVSILDAAGLERCPADPTSPALTTIDLGYPRFSGSMPSVDAIHAGRPDRRRRRQEVFAVLAPPAEEHEAIGRLLDRMLPADHTVEDYREPIPTQPAAAPAP